MDIELICIENVNIQVDIYGNNIAKFKKGDIVKAELCDYGIKIEYKELYYTEPIKVGNLKRYFKINMG